MSVQQHDVIQRIIESNNTDEIEVRFNFAQQTILIYENNTQIAELPFSKTEPYNQDLLYSLLL